MLTRTFCSKDKEARLRLREFNARSLRSVVNACWYREFEAVPQSNEQLWFRDVCDEVLEQLSGLRNSADHFIRDAALTAQRDKRARQRDRVA